MDLMKLNEKSHHNYRLQVSWIRHRDIHILTVGTYTYTTDQRFQTAFHRDINEWTLQIKWAQKRDEGMYECQISTIPIKSYSVRLNIVGEYILHISNGNMLAYPFRCQYSRGKTFMGCPSIEHHTKHSNQTN